MRNREPYITVKEHNDGWAAILVGRNQKGFEEVIYTSIGRFRTKELVAAEAKMWADLSGLKYRE